MFLSLRLAKLTLGPWEEHMDTHISECYVCEVCVLSQIPPSPAMYAFPEVLHPGDSNVQNVLINTRET